MEVALATGCLAAFAAGLAEGFLAALGAGFVGASTAGFLVVGAFWAAFGVGRLVVVLAGAFLAALVVGRPPDRDAAAIATPLMYSYSIALIRS